MINYANEGNYYENKGTKSFLDPRSSNGFG